MKNFVRIKNKNAEKCEFNKKRNIPSKSYVPQMFPNQISMFNYTIDF